MTAPAVFPLPATAYTLPLLAPFRGLTDRQGMIIHGRSPGEFSPFAEYTQEQDARWLVAAVEAALDDDPGPGNPVTSNAIVADVPDERLGEAVEQVLTGTGCRTVKLKVGGRSTGDELHRVSTAARAARGVVDDVRLRLDGNGRFGLDDAREFLVALSWADIPVEYVEQPCDSLRDMQVLHGDTDIPLAVDEGIRRDRSFDDLAAAADVAILKVAPLGGLAAAAELAASLPLPVVVSGAAESGIGVGRDAVGAARFGAPDRAHGLGTGTLLAADLTAHPVVPIDGVVAASRAPVDGDALARAADLVSDAERVTWRQRLDDAWGRALDLGLVGDEMLAELGALA